MLGRSACVSTYTELHLVFDQVCTAIYGMNWNGPNAQFYFLHIKKKKKVKKTCHFYSILLWYYYMFFILSSSPGLNLILCKAIRIGTIFFKCPVYWPHGDFCAQAQRFNQPVVLLQSWTLVFSTAGWHSIRWWWHLFPRLRGFWEHVQQFIPHLCFF